MWKCIFCVRMWWCFCVPPPPFFLNLSKAHLHTLYFLHQHVLNVLFLNPCIDCSFAKHERGSKNTKGGPGGGGGGGGGFNKGGGYNDDKDKGGPGGRFDDRDRGGSAGRFDDREKYRYVKI